MNGKCFSSKINQKEENAFEKFNYFFHIFDNKINNMLWPQRKY